MQKPMIYLDLDDVGYPLTPYLFARYNQDYNDSYNWKNSEYFFMSKNKDVKGDAGYFNHILNEKGVFFSQPPNPEYIWCIDQLLKAGYEVRILTSPKWTSQYCLQEKMAWVKKHISFLPIQNLIFTSLKEEIAQKNRILLDDNPENLKKWEKNGGIGVAYTQIKYSYRWKGKKVSNFKEFFNYVLNLKNE